MSRRKMSDRKSGKAKSEPGVSYFFLFSSPIFLSYIFLFLLSSYFPLRHFPVGGDCYLLLASRETCLSAFIFLPVFGQTENCCYCARF